MSLLQQYSIFVDKFVFQWTLSSRAKYVFFPLFCFSITNFVIFWCLAVYLGGDAFNGHTVNGHYFLEAHGGTLEVSKSVWSYSYYHALSVIISWPLMFLIFAVFRNTGDIVRKKKI